MLMLLVSASAYAQKRTATVKVDYKSNRFMDPQDVNLVSHLGFLNENVNTYADDDKNIYLVEEFAKQVLYTYEDGKEDTIALGYSSGNEVRNAVAIAKWNENLTTKQY